MNRSLFACVVLSFFLLSACGPVGTSIPIQNPYPTYDFPEPEEFEATWIALETAKPTHTTTPTITLTPTASPLPPPPSLDEAKRIYQESIRPLYAALNRAAEKSEPVLSPSSTWKIQLVPGSEREYLIQYLLFGGKTFGNPAGQTLLYITYSYLRGGCLGIFGWRCDVQESKLLSKLVVKSGNAYVKLEELPHDYYGAGAQGSAEIIALSVNPYGILGDQADEIQSTMQALLYYVGGLNHDFTGKNIVQPAGNTRVAILKLVLASPYWSDREAALWSLEEFEGLLAYPEIVQALYDKDTHVQRAAVVLLGRIGPQVAAAVPDLIKKLQEEDTGVRCDIFTAFGDIGGDAREVLPLMISEVETGGKCQEQAMKALGKLGGSAAPAIPALEKVVAGDQDSQLQWVAANALADIGEPALDALIVCLGNDDTTIQYVAAESIGEIGPAASAAVPALIKALEESKPASAKMFFDALGGVGPGASQAVPVLVEYLQDEELGKYAAEALGKIGPAAMPVVPELIKLLNAEDAFLRYDVSEALQAITGQDLGMQVEPWQQWWDTNKPGS